MGCRREKEDDDGVAVHAPKERATKEGCWSQTAVRIALVFVNIYILKNTLTPRDFLPARPYDSREGRV